jgi:cell division protein FtsB
MKLSWNWPSPRRLLYGAVVLLFAALAVNGIFGPHGWVATYHLRLQVHRQQQAIQKLKQENEQLSNEVRQLKSDPSAIERIARERMGLVKPGELVFKAPGKPASSASPAPRHAAAAPATPANSAVPAHR